MTTYVDDSSRPKLDHARAVDGEIRAVQCLAAYQSKHQTAVVVSIEQSKRYTRIIGFLIGPVVRYSSCGLRIIPFFTVITTHPTPLSVSMTMTESLGWDLT